MRIGFIESFTPPPGVDPDRVTEWSVLEAARLGANIVGGDSRPLFRWHELRIDDGYLSSVRDLADSHAIQIEPYIRAPFDLVGDVGATARAETIASIRAARILGGPHVRTAYGRSSIQHSRFADEPIAEHLDRLAASLRIAARIAGDEGVIIAVENHGDFTGAELKRLLEQVDSAYVRCAYDTANSMTVFSDPVQDAHVLLPWIVTTHIKDVVIFRDDRRDRTPFAAGGCAPGSGVIDLRAIVQLLLTQGPRGADTPFIVEVSWPRVAPGMDPDIARHSMVVDGVRYLQRLADELA
jgi:sugar phosphate isomerase/epimerase